LAALALCFALGDTQGGVIAGRSPAPSGRIDIDSEPERQTQATARASSENATKEANYDSFRRHCAR
jgi:hypothetical protein